ncbi:Gfo/Idh/MocA family oxidoreductase [bacterium]|nr:Gfo/Idh/MocA family oxidoreductase [bacterium]
MIKLAFLGTNEGNGHIFSWSAIINGKFDKKLMKNCGYPVIYEYLTAQPEENLGIKGAKVSYVWTEDKYYSEKVAKTSFIENVVGNPKDVIGKVDGVVITTDIGKRHLKLARPFIEKNIPVFIDKPLTDNENDLKEFIKYYNERKLILSSSSLRYAKEIEELKIDSEKIDFVSCIMSKSWERYGVHAVEGLFKILGSGIEKVLKIGKEKVGSYFLWWKNGKMAEIQMVYNSKIFGRFFIFGKETVEIETNDYFYMFKKQMEEFIQFIRTRKYPYSFEETTEIIKVIIAGIKSKRLKREVKLEEINGNT